MISSEDIAKAKTETNYIGEDHHHEHDDCIRMAYEWLDAQKKTKNPTKTSLALKHIIEDWAGRYVSQSDVEVAAHMHPDINGSYPFFNISTRLTEPLQKRLENIAEAHTQSHGYRTSGREYFHREQQPPRQTDYMKS